MSLTASVLDPGVVLVAEGILPWIDRKGGEVQDTARVVASVVALGFMILTAIKSRGAVAAIAASGLVAGMFLWFVFNITAVKDRVEDEVNDQAVVLLVTDPSPPIRAWPDA